jgi:hypothetical protein
MHFKLSEQETQDINKVFSEAVDSLLLAADRLETLEKKLHGEFASISREHQLRIEEGTTRMSSAFWRIKIQDFKTAEAGRQVKELPGAESASQGELPGLIA